MKFSIKTVAAAVSLALLSVSAQAALVAPAQGSAVPANTGLYLEAWNATTQATELVNLSYAYTDIASANLSNFNTPTGAAWTSAANPAGTGTVEQLNFGQIANATAGAFTNFAVVSAATATQSGITSIEGVTLTSGSSPAGLTTVTGLNTVMQNIQSEVANWASLTSGGTYFDATGGTTVAAVNGPTTGGSWNNSQISAAAVGTAASFYNIIGNTSTKTADGLAAKTAATTTYNGFWYLGTDGSLSYNIASASPVPLPAAVWLFGSGLLGLFGVGRRRAVAA